MTVEYRCHFRFKKGVRTTNNTSSRIDNFDRGFWVNSNFDFPLDEKDRRWWIPFHEVKHIEMILV